jgi:hypothetical protein
MPIVKSYIVTLVLGSWPKFKQLSKFNWKQTHDLVKDKRIGTLIWTKGIIKIKSKKMSQPYPWAHKQFKSKTCKMLKRNMRFDKSKGALKQKKMWKIKGKHFGWKYPWVVPLGTTSRNEKGTKNNQIIFLGHVF